MRAKNVLDIAFNDVIEKIRGFRRAEIIRQCPQLENPIWRVLAWANILLPPIPEGIQDQVRWYFGKEVKHNG